MNWLIENNKLVKVFSFENQSKLVLFLQIIANKADEMGHHPDVTIYKCSHMKIELTTHDLNSISQLDYELASFIDEIK